MSEENETEENIEEEVVEETEVSKNNAGELLKDTGIALAGAAGVIAAGAIAVNTAENIIGEITKDATQGDMKTLENAEVIFYNGLHLEGQLQDIFDQMGKDKTVFAAAEVLKGEQLLVDEVMFGLVGEGCKSWDDVEKTLKDKGYTNPDGSELKIDKSPEGIAKLQSDAAKGKTLWADPDGTPVYVDVRFKRLKNNLTSTVTNAYIDELKFLASSAKKTEKNLTKNSSQYDKFSKLLKELPDAVAGIAADPERCSLPNMREKLKDVLEAGDEYIKAHMNVKKLSDRQVARIKVVNRLRDLAGEMD